MNRIKSIRSVVPGPQPLDASGPITIIIVAHNLASLYYPFPESFASAVPLGARFLVGDFESSDETREVFEELSHFALGGFELIRLRWPKDTIGGWAISKATQTLLKLAQTPRVLNLQACEVLCDDAVESIIHSTGSMDFRFRHFFGSCSSDLPRGYKLAPRLFGKTACFEGTDGWTYRGWVGGRTPVGGYIHRYSYCFQNEAEAKSLNHWGLYTIRHGEPPEKKLQEVEFYRQNQNYHGTHPKCVQHFLEWKYYDLRTGLDETKRYLESLRSPQKLPQDSAEVCGPDCGG